MNCLKILNKCKSECCQMVPMPEYVINKYKHLVTEDIELIHCTDIDKYITKTKAGYCAFSDRKTGLCRIYDERPKLCIDYGNETHTFLTCSWMSRNGRIRSRQEKRNLILMNKKITGQCLMRNIK